VIPHGILPITVSFFWALVCLVAVPGLVGYLLKPRVSGGGRAAVLGGAAVVSVARSLLGEWVHGPSHPGPWTLAHGRSKV
jgi:hypothetical protein